MTKAIRTHLMLLNGPGKHALDRYQEVFDDLLVDHVEMYGSDEGPQGQIKFARFTLAGAQFSCIDSPIEHDFNMTPAVSLFVECSDARELERLLSSCQPAARGSCRWMTTGSAPATAGSAIASECPSSSISNEV